MPLLEINQIRHICASVRLDESTATQVDKYAAVIHTSADDVVDKALNYVFSKDHDLRDFIKTPQAKQAASTLRDRKGASNGTAEEPAKKLAGVDGMIPHSIAWCCENGVSHRKNFDTPPLEGICRATFVARWPPLKTDHLQEHVAKELPRASRSVEVNQ